MARRLVALIIAAVLLMAPAACGASGAPSASPALEPIDAPDVSAAPAVAAPTAAARPARVLFVGNSHTYFNDMPIMVEQIAAANGAAIDADTIAIGGYVLENHVSDGDVERALRGGTYDAVIFQEQSILPALETELVAETLPAALELDKVADAVATRVIWYQTWGRENGLPEFGFRDFDHMQSAVIAGYDLIARQTDAEVARVGESWQRVLRSGAPIGLHADDGIHATAAGSYVAAVELTETLLGRTLTVAPEVTGVDADTAAAILSFG